MKEIWRYGRRKQLLFQDSEADTWLSCELSKQSYIGAHLEDEDLSHADFSDSDLSDARLKCANLTGAILKGTNLRGADLTGANLSDADLAGAILHDANLTGAKLVNAKCLRVEHLGGAIVSDCELPEELRKFDGLTQVADSSRTASALFLSMLGACAYATITVATTKDADLLTNAGTAKLPLLDTNVPILGFFAIGPAVLLAFYLYFHIYLLRFWEDVARLPAFFCDGRRLDQRMPSWLMNGLVSQHFRQLRKDRPSLWLLQNSISILLGWCLVPLTLTYFWLRYLVRHQWEWGSVIHSLLLAVAIGLGVLFYSLTVVALARKGRPYSQSSAEGKGLVYGWKQQLGAARLASSLVLTILIFLLLQAGSRAAFASADPEAPEVRQAYRNDRKPKNWRDPLAIHPFISLLHWANLGPVAKLTEADVSQKPAIWDGKRPEEFPPVLNKKGSPTPLPAWEQLRLVKGAQLRDGDLRWARARHAFLAKADLRGAFLQYANLTEAQLQQANLQGAHLEAANLSGADLRAAVLTAAELDDASKTTVPTSLEGAKLPGAILRQAILSDARLNGADLSRAKLIKARLERAHLDNAKLSRSYLNGALLKGATLRGANLVEAELSGADLSSTDLSNTDMSGAVLTRARLETANLKGASLLVARLRGVQASGADFTGANLWGADLTSAKLIGALLDKTNLNTAVLAGAHLEGAHLKGAVLSSVDLRGAKLTSDAENQTKLTGADLGGADLRGADFSGTDLSGVLNLKQVQVDVAILDAKTDLPPTLRRRRGGNR